MQLETEPCFSESCSVVSDSLWPHGILQTRILEWVAVPFSRGSSQPNDGTQISRITGDSLPAEPPGEPRNTGVGSWALIYEFANLFTLLSVFKVE